MRNRMSLVGTMMLVAILALAGCTAQAAPAPAVETVATPSAGTAPVAAAVTGMAERLNAGDLEGALAYFADDAMFYVLGLPPNGTEIHSGKEQIRTMLAENVASHFKMEVEILDVAGNAVTTRTTTWHDFTRELGVAPVEATEVYEIADGKIATEAWHISAASLDKLKAALAEMMPPEPEPEALAETPATELAVTFANASCSYEGPLSLQAGPLAVTFEARDQDKEGYALTLFTLQEGKDFADLMASTILDGPPEWANLIFLREALPGEVKENVLDIEQGPLYGVCWSQPPALAIGAVGPFDVVE